MRSAERERALILAAAILDRPSHDPDDDLSVLARQLTRAQEQIDAALSVIPQHPALMECVEALKKLVTMRKSILDDLRTAHSARADAASEWMREDDRDMRNAFIARCDEAEAALHRLQAQGNTE